MTRYGVEAPTPRPLWLWPEVDAEATYRAVRPSRLAGGRTGVPAADLGDYLRTRGCGRWT